MSNSFCNNHMPAYLALEPPEVLDALPDIEGGQNNLVPVAALASAVRVLIPQWGNASPHLDKFDEVELMWRGGKVDALKVTGQTSDAERTLLIPSYVLTNGVHQLFYRFKAWNEIDFQNVPPIEVTIDTIAPILNAGNTQLLFPAEIIEDGVTAGYLEREENHDQVTSEVPPYIAPMPGDIIRWYLSDSQSDEHYVDELTLNIDTAVDPLPALVYEGQVFRDSGDGRRYAHYQIQDRAGNLSLASQRIELLVEVSPIPRDLPFPKVTQASGSGSISKLDPFNAGQGITVEIPASVVLYEGEEVRVSWGVAGKVGYFLGEFSSVPADRKLNVGKDYVPQHMGKSITVKYEVKTVTGKVLPSERLTVDMGMIPRDSMQYGYCDVTQVSASRFPDAGLVVRLLTRWFLIMPGQYVNIYGRGVSATPGLADITFPILTDFEVTQQWIDEEYITDLIVKADIMPFKVPSELTIITRFSFDGKETWTTEEGSPRSKLQLIT